MNNREENVLKNFMRSQPHYTSAQTGKFVAKNIGNAAIDFQALTASMGMSATKEVRAGETRKTAQAAIDSGKPNLIEICTGSESL